MNDANIKKLAIPFAKHHWEEAVQGGAQVGPLLAYHAAPALPVLSCIGLWAGSSKTRDAWLMTVPAAPQPRPSSVLHPQVWDPLTSCVLWQMLDVSLPFDEASLLRENTAYLQRVLNLGQTPLAVKLLNVRDPPVEGPGPQPVPGRPAPRFVIQPVQQ